MSRARWAAGLAGVALLASCASDRQAAPPPPPTSTSAPAFAPTLDEAREALVRVLDDQGFGDQPGCAAGIVFNAGDDAEVVTGSAGTADLDTGVPLDETTTFDLASVSKQFTAAAVYLLAEDGALSLDDDVHEHVPELPDYGVAVTLDDLVHHTSGLVDYTELLGERFDDTDLTTTAQALDALAAVPDLDFEPGTAFEYSNSNYFLLGLVVARVSGTSLGQFLDERVFTPLGMDDTIVRDDADLVAPHAAEGYAADGDGGFDPDTTNWEQVGDGAVWSNLDDLSHWVANLVTWDVGGHDLETEMLAPGPVLDGGDGYGGGLSLLGDGVVEHSGEWAGFVSELIVDRPARRAVMVLCNRDDADPGAIADDILTLA